VIFIKIIVLGSTGMLGQELTRYFSSIGNDVVGVARNNADYNLDITDDKKLLSCFEAERPDIIINTVAIVNLNECEMDKGNSYLVNSRPAGVISEYCFDNDIYFIQVSTDHYYYGDADKKHLETDKIYLLNEYARTKYVAELLTLNNPNSLVIRTNIVGFRGRKNDTFVEWALNSLKSQEHINVFDDYYTSSIDVYNFSKILNDLIKDRPSGIFNIASSDVSSKKDFIFSLADSFNLSHSNCTPSNINNDGLIRATSLGLNTEKVENIVGYKLPTLNEVTCSLKKSYDSLNESGKNE